MNESISSGLHLDQAQCAKVASELLNTMAALARDYPFLGRIDEFKIILIAIGDESINPGDPGDQGDQGAKSESLLKDYYLSLQRFLEEQSQETDNVRSLAQRRGKSGAKALREYFVNDFEKFVNNLINPPAPAPEQVVDPVLGKIVDATLEQALIMTGLLPALSDGDTLDFYDMRKSRRDGDRITTLGKMELEAVRAQPQKIPMDPKVGR